MFFPIFAEDRSNETHLPLTIHTRDDNVSLTLGGDGTVRFNGEGQGAVIARCDPEAPQFRQFVRTWAENFARNAMSQPTLTEIPRELLAGRIVQDPYHPALFQDRNRAETLSDGEQAYPLLKLDYEGSLKPFNEGIYISQEVMALASDPSIKFMDWVEECEGFTCGDEVCVAFGNTQSKEFEGKPRFEFNAKDPAGGAGIKAAVRDFQMGACDPADNDPQTAPDSRMPEPMPADDFDDMEVF